VNLLLTIAGIILAVFMILKAISQKKREKEYEEVEYIPEDEEKEKKRRMGWFAAVIVLAVLGLIVFILTEDMTLPMVLIDNWTIVNAIIFIALVVSYKLVFKREKESEEDEYSDENFKNLIGETN